MQLVHIPPATPQVLEVVPTSHVVPLQQPPLHCPGAEQLVVHFPALQALFGGQSVAERQPQVPLMHALPLGLPVQSAQADEDPHVELDDPDIQVPDAPAQQ